MHAWEAVQKTVDIIEENLDRELDSEELAKAAALSPFYYQRLFSRLVKKPVREYIKLRRLARACGMLEDKGRRILDVALDAGFGSHETFTRAFKEAYGMTPERYRESPVWLNQFDKPDLRLGYTVVDEGVPLVSDGLVLEINRKKLEAAVPFLGLSGYVPIEGQMPLGEGTGVDIPGQLWERFHREKGKIPRKPGGRELGVAYMGDAPCGSFTYFVGAEAAGDVAAGFRRWDLPAGEYAVVGFEAENFRELVSVAVNKAAKYAGMWLAEHGLETGAYGPEMYYGSTPESSYMELWMPLAGKEEE